MESVVQVNYYTRKMPAFRMQYRDKLSGPWLESPCVVFLIKGIKFYPYCPEPVKTMKILRHD